jgi:hypothetical protein
LAQGEGDEAYFDGVSRQLAELKASGGLGDDRQTAGDGIEPYPILDEDRQGGLARPGERHDDGIIDVRER